MRNVTKHSLLLIAFLVSTLSGYSISALSLLGFIAFVSLFMLKVELQGKEKSITLNDVDFSAGLVLLIPFMLLSLLLLFVIASALGITLKTLLVAFIEMFQVNIFKLLYTMLEVTFLGFPLYNSYRAVVRKRSTGSKLKYDTRLVSGLSEEIEDEYLWLEETEQDLQAHM